jgi:DNA-binding transcriptional LysR family regulator
VGVGFVWSTLGAHVAPLVVAAAERHPDIELSICQLRFVEILPALRRGDVDLAIVRSLHEESEMLELILRREPSMLAIPERHPLARRERLELADLDRLPMVALQRDLAPRAYDALMAYVAELGLRLDIVQQTPSPSEALALVSAGIVVYRLPSTAAQPIRASCTARSRTRRAVSCSSGGPSRRRPPSRRSSPWPAICSAMRITHRTMAPTVWN